MRVWSNQDVEQLWQRLPATYYWHTLQVAGGARGGCAVGGEQPRGQVGDPGEGDAATEETQRRLRGAGVEVGWVVCEINRTKLNADVSEKYVGLGWPCPFIALSLLCTMGTMKS